MKAFLRPPPLSAGDTIAIVPTARAVTLDELRDGIALAEGWGLKVRLGAGIGRRDLQQAGTAEERAGDLRSALEDPTVRAIWCARGGYGTVQLLEHLDLSSLRRDPKWIIGFSDVTVLHNAIHNMGICSMHAQMPHNIGAKSEGAVGSLKSALFGDVRAISPGPGPVMRTGEGHGRLLGGNLSVLHSLRGTPYDIDPRGAILLLEDLDELLYHVDRMVMNLKLGGWFDALAGLVIGGMNDMRNKNEEDPFGPGAEEIIRRALGRTTYPVCSGFPVGHIADNRAVVLGRNAKLSVTSTGATLSFEDEEA